MLPTSHAEHPIAHATDVSLQEEITFAMVILFALPSAQDEELSSFVAYLLQNPNYNSYSI